MFVSVTSPVSSRSNVQEVRFQATRIPRHKISLKSIMNILISLVRCHFKSEMGYTHPSREKFCILVAALPSWVSLIRQYGTSNLGSILHKLWELYWSAFKTGVVSVVRMWTRLKWLIYQWQWERGGLSVSPTPSSELINHAFHHATPL